ncbi:hypothetical protein niasHT_013997 [Heterodera trifolii]|uniref:CCHC-type domain-containing protein n=1 Tax=Heterodera trifolii TaxID=157864 RepID=A0ABD2KLI9_9BILA
MQQPRQNKTSDKGNFMEQPQRQEGLQIGALEFVLTMERFPELNGTEGPSQIRKFLKKFLSATEEWPESRRISALESKISGKAERAFDAVMKHRPENFNEFCRGMEEILSEWDCTEMKAFNELWAGVKQQPDESLDEFAERLYGIVERAYPGLPSNFVSDFAIKHLIPVMENPEISVGLEMARRPGMSFDSFVALAVRAEEVQKATKSADHKKFFAPKTNRIVCYNCNKTGHISRHCRLPFARKQSNCARKPPRQNFATKSADFRKNSEAEKKLNDLRLSNQPLAQRTNVEAGPKRKASNRQRNSSSSSCSVKAKKMKEKSAEIPKWFLNAIVAALVVFAGTFSKEKSKIGRIWKSKSPTRNTDDVKGRKADEKLGTIFSPKAGEELADLAAANLENLLKIGKSLSFPNGHRKCAQEAATDEFIRPGLTLQRDFMPNRSTADTLAAPFNAECTTDEPKALRTSLRRGRGCDNIVI